MPVNPLLTSLESLPGSGPRDAYLRFLNSAGDAALRRDGGPEHVTGSCFVFSPDFDHVLLCFHRKGQFWLQFGGHIESKDASVAEAAQREAREESGVGDLVLLSTAIVDLDRHDLHAGFSCSAHWDVGFAAAIDLDVEISVSDESEDVRWFRINELPALVPLSPDCLTNLVLVGGDNDLDAVFVENLSSTVGITHPPADVISVKNLRVELHSSHQMRGRAFEPGLS